MSFDILRSESSEEPKSQSSKNKKILSSKLSKVVSIDNSNSKITDNEYPDNNKHPLNSTWKLWYTKPKISSNEKWSALLRPIMEIKTLEEFWALNSLIPSIDQLPVKVDYHLFRTPLRPEWEDENNSKGGKIIVEINDIDRMKVVWLNLMLMAICEHFEDLEPLKEEDEAWLQQSAIFYNDFLNTNEPSTEEPQEDEDDTKTGEYSSIVNGVVFSKRNRFLRASIWTRHSNDKSKAIQIAQKMRTVILNWLDLQNLEQEVLLEIDDDHKINYGKSQGHLNSKWSIKLKFLTLKDNVQLVTLPVERKKE
ncbi:translation initiation factor eIF4e [Hanseniaspora valbyensis NRRL Y-1626]|uniref:Translation initiation factor eIF4e n=1 Tax=Hanseniaspora valbyensis NRRL Y-1626 TaxID=766949 RepID=A0A1B7TJ56_9ASCO|nr:translation initiation factor eIF4e [Hanseniaspora valbyensis NRRL Y-1626]